MSSATNSLGLAISAMPILFHRHHLRCEVRVASPRPHGVPPHAEDSLTGSPPWYAPFISGGSTGHPALSGAPQRRSGLLVLTKSSALIERLSPTLLLSIDRRRESVGDARPESIHVAAFFRPLMRNRLYCRASPGLHDHRERIRSLPASTTRAAKGSGLYVAAPLYRRE